MADIKLFKLGINQAEELLGENIAVEKSLQKLIEAHLETFLGIRFLASEYSTGKVHGGRVDTLGVDENNCPVIIEYKRATNQNVINQGLFYLDWLLDHQAEFKLLLQEKTKIASKISDLDIQVEWSSPRLICIAGDFTKYDLHAVSQIDRNIELIRYVRFGDELLVLELVNAKSSTDDFSTKKEKSTKRSHTKYTTFDKLLIKADLELTDLHEEMCATMRALGDDVQEKQLKYYRAFKRLKNFACIEVHPQNKLIRIYLNINPKAVELEEAFSRDVTNIGHHGTGNLELTIRNKRDLEKSIPLIFKSYQDN